MYDYYDADDANLARRGQVRRVEAPGGYWREMDYGGAGWLVRREVQTADGSEVTTYTYDAWGRLRAIDYPRSADGLGRREQARVGSGRRRASGVYLHGVGSSGSSARVLWQCGRDRGCGGVSEL